MDSDTPIRGELLNEIGLAMPVQDPETALLIYIKAV